MVLLPRFTWVNAAAAVLLLLVAEFLSSVNGEVLTMLKTVRVTFERPRLSPRPIFVHSGNDFYATVEIRKTYVQFEVESSDETALPF